VNATDRTSHLKQSKYQLMDSGWSCPNPTLDLPPLVEQLARRRLTSDCPFAFYFRDITLRFADGRLSVRGRVPTFYLKQILQSRLKGIDGVELIDDQVDVVSSTGLSSARS
jgi:hypothetical protein